MRILGLDVGEKRIGIAVSDELCITAQPLETLVREDKKKDIVHINEIVKRENIGEIVVGMPLGLKGQMGQSAEKVADFIADLKKAVYIEIKMQDERFSTAQAENILLEADVSRKKRKAAIDKIAAVLILQNYLDRKQAGV